MRNTGGEVAIIGTGITGLVAGYALHSLSPDTSITFLDAGPEPLSSGQHHGATLGQSRDARQFTGTEGLSFQNPVHTGLFFEPASNDGPGWQTLPEQDLTARERSWRDEALARYENDVTPDSNPYDEMYTALNYGGMAAWTLLARLNPALAKYRTETDSVYVAFANEPELSADLRTEAEANPLQANSPVDVSDVTLGGLAKHVLRVPGQAWQIKSVWQQLYGELQDKPGINFNWDSPVENSAQLPPADHYVWAAGSGYRTPDFYEQNGRVQGIGGWWLSAPNPGITVPFKLSAPQPSGYMNFTPVDDSLHISGGFGWVGERQFEEAVSLLEPAKQQFLKHVSEFLGISVSTLANYDIGGCIRPTTPTGLPDLATLDIDGQKHTMLSGAGKAGATQASILGLHAVSEIIGDERVEQFIINLSDEINASIITKALRVAKAGFEPAKS